MNGYAVYQLPTSDDGYGMFCNINGRQFWTSETAAQQCADLHRTVYPDLEFRVVKVQSV